MGLLISSTLDFICFYSRTLSDLWCSLDILEETSQVVFNTAELELTDASIYSESLKTQQVQSSRTVDKKMERASVHFPTALPAGSKAQLQIGFQGKLTGSMQGEFQKMMQSNRIV